MPFPGISYQRRIFNSMMRILQIDVLKPASDARTVTPIPGPMCGLHGFLLEACLKLDQQFGKQPEAQCRPTSDDKKLSEHRGPDTRVYRMARIGEQARGT